MKEMKNFTRIGLFLVITALSGVSALAVDLPGFKVPKGGTETSQTFNVPSAGSLRVDVKVRVAPLVFIPVGGRSTYKAMLMRPDGTADGNSGRVGTTGSDFITLQLTTTVTCAQTGNWKVKVTNTGTENPQDGDVEFPPFNVPQLETHTTTLPAFTLNQGLDVVRFIPPAYRPIAPGGIMKISATWDSDVFSCGFSGCKATLTLFHEGQPYGVSSGGRSTGFAANAAGDPNTKASVSIFVPNSDVSGNWSLHVKAGSNGEIRNVKPTVTFVERCSN